ncbi:mitochondrial import receptor subunit TOM70-like protein, partial [Leptotrombidium deliense]
MFHDGRAAVYEKLKDLKNFHKDCEAAINLDKNYVNTYRRRGQLLWKLDEYLKATEDLISVCIVQKFEDKKSIEEAEKAILQLCEKPADDLHLNINMFSQNQFIVDRKYFRQFNRHPLYQIFPKLFGKEAESMAFIKTIGYMGYQTGETESPFHPSITAFFASSDAPRQKIFEDFMSPSALIMLNATFYIISHNYSIAENQLEEIMKLYEKNPDFST